MRRSSGLFGILLFSVVAFAQAPVCDVSCGPDPGSGTYAGTAAARPLPRNARGQASSVVPQTYATAPGSWIEPPIKPVAVTDPVPKLPGSESYNYDIPIVRLPGRNGLDLNLTLHYSSRLWTVDSANGTVTFNADRDFPSYGFRLDFGFIDTTGGTFVLTEADGTKRRMNLVAASSYDTDDSSYINYDSTSKILKYKDGTQVLYEVFPSSSALLRPKKITDTNGNYITILYVTHVAGKPDDLRISTITDTLGRIITFTYDGSDRLISLTQGTKTYATFAWDTAALNYTFDPSLSVVDTQDPGTVINVLVGCRYANNTGYNFHYGDWGIVNRIDRVSSTGDIRSYVTYNYPTAGTALADAPTYTAQTVVAGANTSTWNYSTAKVNGLVSSFTITDPVGTATVFNLFTAGDWKDGLLSSAQTPLRTVANDWVADATTNRNARVSRVTTTLNDSGQQSKVEYSYSTYGNFWVVKEYDYGLVLKRQTALSYLGTSAYTTNHILDRVTQVLVKDGSNTIVSRTNLSYDGTTLTSVTGTASHDPAYGTTFPPYRGNVTSVTRYADAAGSGGPITKNFYYDTLGNLRTADLDCCNQKQWNFSSLTQYAYPDSIVRGPVGTQLTTSATYNFASGTVATSRDENNQQTSYGYDSVDRLTTVTLPNSVILTTQYDDAATEPNVTRSSTANSLAQFTRLDGLGRPIRSEVRNGTAAVSTRETIYDAAGRPVQTSNPYGSGESVFWTVTAYDSLNRVTTVTPPGNVGSYSYTYAGNTVTIEDPAHKLRKNFTDALGRLTQVDEPGWGDGLPGHGSVTIAGVPHAGEYGQIVITVNALTKTAYYTAASTAVGLATSLANAFNSDTSSPVNASTAGATINFTAKLANASTNYPLAVSVSSTRTPPSITATPSGPALTGAADPTQPTSSPTLATPMTTSYYYDMLDNLTKVLQAPQQRIYSYDSLSRLLSAQTPESGTASYTYNSFSQVATRTDARGVITSYTYDGLNRPYQVIYNVGSTGVPATPTVTFGYDSGGAAAYALGRLTSTAAAGAASETYSYNAMGWITQVAKTINGAGYTIGYGYDNAGNLTALTYPSGRVVQQQYDPIGRLTQLLGAGGPYLIIDPSTGYTGAGQVKHVLYGNAVTGDFTYNERVQVASIRYTSGAQDLLNLAYGYGTENNGQIASITDNLDTTKSTAYAYDPWSRIKQATAGTPATPTWALSWDYDRFGNRRNQNVTVSGPQVLLNIDQMTNRIADGGYAYDPAGNMTQESLGVTSHSYTYDAENRMKTVDATAATYTYASGPLRIKKVVGSTTTVYIFSGSKVIAEYLNGGLNKEYVYAGSKLLATLNPNGSVASYQHPDHLSTRVETDGNGVTVRTFGHYPFGETWYETGPPSKWKFTTYERDEGVNESQLDYAIFRYYSSRVGRFIQADPLGGDTLNPQSLNRYSYVANDPVNLTDPLGLDTGSAWFDWWMNAANNTYMSGPALAQEFADRDLRSQFGSNYFDLPGYEDPVGQAYYQYAAAQLGWLARLYPEGSRPDGKDLYLPLHCQPEVRKMFEMIWNGTAHGTSHGGWEEAGFSIGSKDGANTFGKVVYSDPNDPKAVSGEIHLNIPLPPGLLVAAVHTHPAAVGPYPSGVDKANKKPVYVISRNGLFVTVPEENRYESLGTDWSKGCKK